VERDLTWVLLEEELRCARGALALLITYAHGCDRRAYPGKAGASCMRAKPSAATVTSETHTTAATGAWGRAVSGNASTLDLAQLPWLLVIGNGSSLELRDLVLTNPAPPSAAANTSYLYAGGLLAWPSLAAEPGSALRRYNVTQFFWSSARYGRGDCDWQRAGPPRDGGAQVIGAQR